jgi:hypothetical protein
VFKRDKVPLKQSLPPSPSKGEGVGKIIASNSELAARNIIISQMQAEPSKKDIVVFC